MERALRPAKVQPEGRADARQAKESWDMSILAWVVLGTIAGYVAGYVVKGDEGLGIVGHTALGILGALLGGFTSTLLFGFDPMHGPLIEIPSFIAAVLGSVVLVVLGGVFSGKPRTGRGAI
jgi:uncharacterized membrane protein YeaQ/YmgE (transglycosylase-associated protein family)